MKASTLTELGFLRSAAEPCLWIRNDARGVLITGVIVDDFVITDSSLQLCDEFAAQLMKIWDCTYIGDMEWCINLRIRRDRERRRMTIDQSEYVDAVAAVKRIIKYLRGTRTWGLCYFSSYLGGAKWTLTLYVDSGYGMDPDKRRSRYGYVVFLNGNPVSFGTGLDQRTVTSTPEVEYVAMAHGLKELI